MKKIIAILMTLCLMCAAGAGLADMEIPAWDSMPGVVLEDENTTVDEKAFEGEWVLNVAFFGREYVDEQKLAGDFGFNFMPLVIGDGMLKQDVQNMYGEFETMEMPYTFEAGQLQCEEEGGRSIVVELLDDGNIVVSVFFPGEGDETVSLSVFMKHPEE